MELHVWGALSPNCASFDPECLALIWLVATHNMCVKVYASNNTCLSPARRLPVLIDGDVLLTGFMEIAFYLEAFNGSLAEEQARDVAMQAYLGRLGTLTAWTLFCNKENYEKITRPEISALIAFPMQYNVALTLQRDATNRSEREGITNKKTLNAIGIPKEKGLSSVHEKMLQETRSRQKSLKRSQQTMQVITAGTGIYDLLAHYAEGPLTPARLLLAANMCIQCDPALPERPLTAVIASHRSLEALRDKCAAISTSSVMAATELGKQYTFVNWLCSWTPYSSWASGTRTL